GREHRAPQRAGRQGPLQRGDAHRAGAAALDARGCVRGSGENRAPCHPERQRGAWRGGRRATHATRLLAHARSDKPMKVLAANIEDVFREAAARWTLIAYFCLSSIFIIIFASAVNLDVVNGALAGAKLFGNDMQVGGGALPIEKIVTGFESGFSSLLYGLSIFLAIFATAHLVPRMQDKGTIDLYLSRPVARAKLLFSRYFAGLLLAASNVLYLITAIGLIVMWKTRIVHPRF